MARRPQGSRVSRAACWLLGLLLKTLRYVGVLLVLLTIAFTWYGLPTPITAHLMRNVDTGNLAVNARRVQLDLRHGLRFRDAMIYRKGDIGPPVMEAADLVLSISPMALWRGGQPLRGMILRDGTLRRSKGGRPRGSARDPLTIWLEIEDCEVLGIWIESANLTYRTNARDIWYDNMHGIAGKGDGSGPFSASVHLNTAERKYDGHVQARIDLASFHGFFEAFGLDTVIDFTQRFTFENEMPSGTVDFAGAIGSPGFIDVSGKFDMPNTRYRDTACDRFLATFNVYMSGTNRTIRVDPVTIVRDEKVMEAAFTLYPVPGVIDFRLDSTLQPEMAARMMDPALVRLLKPFTFGESTTVYARGHLRPGSLDETSISGEIHGTGLGWGRYQTDVCRFSLDISGRTTSVNRIEGDLYGGKVTGRVRIYPDETGTNHHYAVAGRLEAVGLKDLIESAARKEVDNLDGRLTLSGYVRGMTASGLGPPADGRFKASVRKGRLFRVPLFGGLTELMARWIPGLSGIARQQEASATFEIRDGAAHTKKLQIDGNVLRLAAEGRYRFDRHLDFDVHVTLAKKGLVRDILRFPIELLNETFFEIGLTGTTKEPNWYLKRFSRDLFKKLGFFDKKDKDSVDPKASPKRQVQEEGD